MTRKIVQPLLDITSTCSIRDEAQSESREDVTTQRALGEVGGVMFHSPHIETYLRCGGVSYEPITHLTSGEGGITSAHITATAAKRFRRDTGSLLSVLCDAAATIVTPLVALVPHLRCVLPPFLLRYNMKCHQPIGSASHHHVTTCESVVALAFHHHCTSVLAIAIRDITGVHRIAIYDAATESFAPLILTHPFMSKGIGAMQWKPMSRDTLLVGCNGGVLVWHLSFRHSLHATRAQKRQMSDTAGTYVLRSNVVGADREQHSNASESFWRSISDDSPACVFYPTGGRAAGLTTTIATSSGGAKYFACASSESIETFVFDCSTSPRDALVMKHVTVEGGTTGLCFSRDDSFLVKTISNVACIKVLDLETQRVEHLSTSAAVRGIERCDDARGETSASLFAVVFHQTEGVALVQITLGERRQDGSPCAVMIVRQLISTGIRNGIGGEVGSVRVHNKRMYVQVASGHIIVMSVHQINPHNGSLGETTSVRLVGTLRASGVRGGLGDSVPMAVSPSFHKGSLLATVVGNEVHIIPSYYQT